ncbi:lysozyme inhibitor LprI family protein [Paraburkholderia heleia]|uniref:lysozyme inhibitor LprI family protein n=1 Tax=Paraburkholderia heleia TaxID=634127 RepID=UPI0031D65525
MKKCHFCYEDIQDSAIRCKHCGADIAAAEAATKEAKFEQSYSNGFGKFWAVVGALVFGVLGFGAYTEQLYIDIAICVAFGLVFLFLAPKAWQVGFLARNAGQPDIIIASSAGELAKQRFYYEYGARILLTGGLFVALLTGLYFIVPLDRIVFGPGTPLAASSEAKSSSASVAADLQAVASATTGTEAQPVADGQGTATGEANPIIAASSSQAADTQSVNGAANTAENNPSTTPSSRTASEAAAANGGDASSSVKTLATVPTSVQSGIHASFDCNKASSKIEKLICSTPDAADADARLSVAYAAARAKANDPNALKADQRSWLANERNACSDAACLVRVTNDRIAHLSSI